MTRNIYLIPGRPNLLTSVLATLPAERQYSWIYVGKDVYICTLLEKIIGNRAARISISEDLQKTARQYRDDYIDYIGKIFVTHESPIWFLTSLSEKNPFISDFFLNFCYLTVCLNYIHESERDLIIVGENRAVLHALKENLNEDPDTRMMIYDSPLHSGIENIRYSCAKIKNKLVFLCRYMARVFLAKVFSIVKRHSREIKMSDQLIITHTFTDYRSFPEMGVYKESYLGNLCDDIAKKTTGLVYLSDVLPTLWYPKALYPLFFVKNRIYLKEEFLSLTDIFNAMLYVRTNYPEIHEKIPFGGLNVLSILQEDLSQDRATARVEQSYLNYFISKRISRRFVVKSFLFSFENHVWERAFCDGFKKMGDTKLIAYAIVFINRMYTCYSVSRVEKAVVPHPDIIIVSGSQGKDMLAESGFDADKIIIGGAVRYPNLRADEKKIRHVSKKTVLLALSAEINASLELVFKSVHAFSRSGELNIIIKCHPIVPYNKIAPFLPKLPGHFSISDEPIGILLSRSDLVLYTESTVCVEAVAQGIPIMHVRSDHSIDINIFEGDESVPSYADPIDINSETMRIVNGEEKLPSNELISHLFQPIDMQKIESVFLEIP